MTCFNPAFHAVTRAVLVGANANAYFSFVSIAWTTFTSFIVAAIAYEAGSSLITPVMFPALRSRNASVALVYVLIVIPLDYRSSIAHWSPVVTFWPPTVSPAFS